VEETVRGQGPISLYVFKYENYFNAVAASFQRQTGIQVSVVVQSHNDNWR